MKVHFRIEHEITDGAALLPFAEALALLMERFGVAPDTLEAPTATEAPKGKPGRPRKAKATDDAAPAAVPLPAAPVADDMWGDDSPAAPPAPAGDCPPLDPVAMRNRIADAIKVAGMPATRDLWQSHGYASPNEMTADRPGETADAANARRGVIGAALLAKIEETKAAAKAAKG